MMVHIEELIPKDNYDDEALSPNGVVTHGVNDGLCLFPVFCRDSPSGSGGAGSHHGGCSNVPREHFHPESVNFHCYHNGCPEEQQHLLQQQFTQRPARVRKITFRKDCTPPPKLFCIKLIDSWFNLALTKVEAKVVGLIVLVSLLSVV